ncbi:outer membrane protein assembly factor BamD [soil metagenome]
MSGLSGGAGKLALMLALTLAVSACSGGLGRLLDRNPSTSSTRAASASGDAISPDMAEAEKTESVATLYNKGLDELNNGSYREASKSFAEVERQHPYSKWATKAQLMQAYTQYQRNSYDESINAATRFITLHPGNKDAAYAYYLIALSNYEQIIDIKRDQTNTRKALDSLEEVGRRFPGTQYAADAAVKARLARDHLAGKEMEIGRYYVENGSYLAGINRFKRVITEYQETTHTPEALYRLTESYLALGVRSEAQTAAAVLGHNFPDSDWYRDAYGLLKGKGYAPEENKQSWISKALSKVNPF